MSKCIAATPVSVFGNPTVTFVTVTPLHHPSRAQRSAIKHAISKKKRFITLPAVEPRELQENRPFSG
jgi:hypothetical protein